MLYKRLIWLIKISFHYSRSHVWLENQLKQEAQCKKCSKKAVENEKMWQLFGKISVQDNVNHMLNHNCWCRTATKSMWTLRRTISAGCSKVPQNDFQLKTAIEVYFFTSIAELRSQTFSISGQGSLLIVITVEPYFLKTHFFSWFYKKIWAHFIKKTQIWQDL